MDTETPSTDAPLQLPRRTTPTWEMELLLSGATVFTLWQLAGYLAPATAYLLPRLAPEFAEIGGVMYVYLASGVIMLGLTFGLHLALRAYWVALVGMHSVYPQGLRMEGIKGGPIAKAALKAGWRGMDEGIERADNRATLVFGLGIGVASTLIPITLFVATLYALVAAACWALDAREAIRWAFPVASLGLLLPFFVVYGLDRYLDGRIAPDGRLHRGGVAILRLYSRIGMGREGNPLVTLYSSNVGDGRGTLVVMAIMLVTLFLASASLLTQRMELGPGSYAGVPEPWRGMPATVDGRHYASMHEPGTSPAVPYLPAPVVRGDYARLVVPFVPGRHGEALAGCHAARAPDAAAGPRGAAAAEAVAREALLRCYAARFSLRLGEQPLDLRPDWYLDPSRDVRGLLYMVDVRALPAGRHELVLASPGARRDPDPDEAPPPDRIPFWR